MLCVSVCPSGSVHFEGWGIAPSRATGCCEPPDMVLGAEFRALHEQYRKLVPNWFFKFLNYIATNLSGKITLLLAKFFSQLFGTKEKKSWMIYMKKKKYLEKLYLLYKRVFWFFFIKSHSQTCPPPNNFIISWLLWIGNLGRESLGTWFSICHVFIQRAAGTGIAEEFPGISFSTGHVQASIWSLFTDKSDCQVASGQFRC